MKSKLSRLEANREVRRVLVRHGADLAHCTYSCTGNELRITGSLIRIEGSNFNSHQIESIIQDFLRHLKGFTINGDLDNWNFGADHVTRIGKSHMSPIEYDPEEEAS